MSQEKAQLIAPLGNMSVPGVTATGVITATSFEGNITGSATSIKQGSSVSAGVVTASSFVGNLTGNIQRLADSGPNISVGVVTATSFSGNLTGSVTDLTSAPAITVGVVTATTLKGPVTGNITGNVSGHAGGLGVSYNGGWPGAGTSQISAGVMTATTFYGDGSNLDGVSSGPVSQQAVTIDGASTVIDLSNGNLIYASQSANTTVSFANSENGNVYFVRVKDASTTARTITWPDRILWEGGTAPTLITTDSTVEAQVFLLVTRDMGVTWYGKEVVNADLIQGFDLYVVGEGSWGATAQDLEVNRSSPVQIPGDWSILSYGNINHNLAIRNNQTLWAWGRNNGGQLGQNSATPGISSPVQIPGTTWGYGITGNIPGGVGVSMATKTDGTLWAWGNNGSGQLGQNDTAKYSSPVQIPGTTWKNEMYSGCQGYGSWACAIKTDGTIWSWGYGNFGQLGNNKSFGSPGYVLSSPIQIGTDTNWSQVSGGVNQPLAIRTNGELWAWGYNNDGELGLNDTPHRSSPCQVGTDTTWSQVTNSYLSVQAIKTNGTLWAWGKNEYGQLAQNNGTSRSSPTQIGTDTTWHQVRAGQNSMWANKTDGTLWAWGLNTYGGLGQNDVVSYSSPTQIPGTNWKSTNNYGFAGNYYGLSVLRT